MRNFQIARVSLETLDRFEPRSPKALSESLGIHLDNRSSLYDYELQDITLRRGISLRGVYVDYEVAQCQSL